MRMGEIWKGWFVNHIIHEEDGSMKRLWLGLSMGIAVFYLFSAAAAAAAGLNHQTSITAPGFSAIAEEFGGDTANSRVHPVSTFGAQDRKALLLCAAPAEKPEAAPKTAQAEGETRLLRVGVEAWMLKKFDLAGAAERFGAAHPGAKIEYIPVETADTTSYMLQWSQKKTNVDVVIGGSRENAVPYAAKDLLMTFDEGFFDSRLSRQDFIPSFLELGAINGRQYLIPIMGQIMHVTVRKDLMRDAGLTDAAGKPKPPRDWDEFYDYARKLTRQEGGKTVATGLSIDWGKNFMAYTYLSCLQGVRGSIYDGASRYLDFQSKEAKQLLEAWVKLVKAGYTPVDTFANMDAGRSNFMAGKVAMHISSVSRWQESAEVLGAGKVTGMPLPGSEQNGTLAFISGIMIPRVSKNPEMAKQFIKEALMDKGFQLWTLNKYGKMPVLTRNYQGAEAPEWQEILDTTVKAASAPLYKDWPKMDNEMQVQFQRAITGQQSVEQTMKHLDSFQRTLDISTGLEK